MELLKTELVRGDPPVLRVEGEIDLSTAELLRTSLEAALASDPGVVVDLAGVTFFDATGIRVLLQVADSLNGSGPLQLDNASPLARVLELVGLDDLAAIRIRSLSDARGR